MSMALANPGALYESETFARTLYESKTFTIHAEFYALASPV